MTGTQRRRGMVLPITVAVIFVIAAFVFALYKFQSHRVWVTGVTVNDISALAAAEAGIACALAEVRAARNFATHDIQAVDSSGVAEWGAARPWTAKVQSGLGLTLDGGGTGVYSGTVGDAPYAASFKVKVGYLPDLSGTNASGGEGTSRYLYVEALGMREDPGERSDRVTRVRVMVERINFSEFLIYDGGYLTLGMGSRNDPGNFNIFADGRLYGHEWVHLGDISNNGTTQKFINLTSIRSKGKIKAQSNYQIHFQAQRNFDGSVSGQPGFTVAFNSSNDSYAASNVETAEGRILDGDHGGKLEPQIFDEATFRNQTGAMLLAKAPVRREWHSHPEFDSMDWIEIDFGRALYDGAGDDGEPQGLGQGYPSNFNGVIFVNGNVAVWGNPDRDISVVATGQIFVSGDFNMKETFPQNYQPNFVSEVSGDEDTGARVTDAPYYTYVEPEKLLEDDRSTRVPPDEATRMACALITKQRVWRDYTRPGRILRNELLGLMAYDISGELLAMPTTELNPAPTGGENWRLQWVAKDDPGTARVRFNSFSATGGTADADGVPALHPGLEIFDRMFPWDVPDQAISAGGANYGTPDPQANMKLLPRSGTSVPASGPAAFGGTISASDVPQYLLPARWYVTLPTKIKIHNEINRRFQASGGELTYQMLWGDGAGDAGLLWTLYGYLLEDEEYYFQYKGLGFPPDTGPERTSRLALATRPQWLYNLVRDENAEDPLDQLDRIAGESPGPRQGRYSDDSGRKTPMQNDRLFYPQMTINAMIFTYAKKNHGNSVEQEQNANNVNIVYHELGNAAPESLKWLAFSRFRNGTASGGSNIITPIVQRIRGSVVDFAQGDIQPPRLGRHYYPPIRRRIYDPDLTWATPPGVPQTAKVLSWNNLGATPKDYADFQ